MSRMDSDLDALQAELDALKRLQAETAADPLSLRYSATRLDGLLHAILSSSPSFDAIDDRAFKGEL
jgi:hypothetical protein